LLIAMGLVLALSHEGEGGVMLEITRR
jgi:hypothetical protein